MAVTPIPGLNSVVTVGGTAVVAIGPNPNGGVITNPYTAPGPLYVDAVTTAGVVANGTTFALQPGQSWTCIAGQTTSTSVNSNVGDDLHVFSVFSY